MVSYSEEESKAGLAGRVKQLGVDISEVKRADLTWRPAQELPNHPGKQSSLQIYMAIADQGVIGPEEAARGLTIFGQELRDEAASDVGRHPSIDLLEGIVTGEITPVNLGVVRHPEMEVLSPEKEEKLKEVAARYGTPAYVFFENELESNIQELMSFPNAFGLTVRYAAKAFTNGAIIKFFERKGAHFDASTTTEAFRLIMGAKIPGEKIRLTSQQVPEEKELELLVGNNLVKYTACSLRQLELFGRMYPGHEVGVRFNLGIGSGWTAQTSTGGITSSFGIYEHITEIKALVDQYNLKLKTFHVHIGSGSDPEKQKQAAIKALDLIVDLPTITDLNFGGGIKYGRMNYEHSTDIKALGRPTKEAVERFAQQTGRRLHIEIEPGTRAVAGAGYVLGEVRDIVDTGSKGFTFLKVNTGMTDNTRIALYAAQHPMIVIPMDDSPRGIKDYIVVGPCCESGDILTVRPGAPETIDPRRLREAKFRDLFVMAGCGAYCSSMSPSNYNSLLKSPEVLVRNKGRIDLIRSRQELMNLWKDEIIPGDLK